MRKRTDRSKPQSQPPPPKERELVLLTQFFQDLRYWVQENPTIAGKILDLVADTTRSPFSGLGKPELLKHDLRGYWSRRITDEHRLVYKVTDTEIRLHSARYHY